MRENQVSLVEFAGMVRQQSIVVELNDHCGMLVGCKNKLETDHLRWRSSML